MISRLGTIRFLAWLKTLEKLRGEQQNWRPSLDRRIVVEGRARYGAACLEQTRLGPGALPVLVTEAYERRCSITGERTLPVLQASHIKPFSQDGEHRVSNGLLLRADLHILFDQGVVSVTPEHEVLVSDAIKERSENGRDYYALRGQRLKILPASQRDLPDPELLRWHNLMLFVATGFARAPDRPNSFGWF